ncbi:tyrosine--tRNA ligase TYS1 [Aspergillus ruber CBS 135680]|uniref:Tyrosine--tRNA ligase n=1 Tax=Aspergillus ruber (strain CBS 135680) TaxID=1388766 RepID=A0A017SRB8_ASPRC|nr:tyrosyl-tRNA synthetase [Aspergillus ruber CBS 135680]EYE98835.1 tyrosyl-tRNA synthetase [Aspergillus ruber CBS 135680]
MATKEAKLELIRENLAEVLNPEIIDEVLDKGETLRIYWGTAPTGKPHCGYFVPIMKIAQFLQAGCNVKILLADVHAFLDNLKAPIELVEYRAKYYRYCITALMRAVNVPIEKLEFVLGSSYQMSAKYTMDVYRLASLVTEHDAKKAGAEVVKQSQNAPISGLMYPLLQALDEEALDVHAQFGGADQRKIFALAMETLPKLGYKTRAHIMNKMVPGLAGGKMSASDPNSKIDLLDTPEVSARKIKKANAPPKVVEENGLLAFVENVLLPASSLLDGERSFKVDREGAEPLVYGDIESLRKDYVDDVLTPQLLKPAVNLALRRLLDPIQNEFNSSSEWQEIEKKAYPADAPKEKKQKTKKDKGSKYPGAAKAEEQAEQGKEPSQATASDVGKSASEAMDKLSVQ